ncbi:uncharacterized protein LOC62_04G006388 [Vanrija pseudolonga]|uniref:Uncharacterized protein n=1 Tax=Vanrija pseudolonga TaxID=143232 RepID=A0AAF0YA20_9TREE|nr:hypothetical protein LOC62_04G006388 [Vanrija pseudolonga]
MLWPNLFVLEGGPIPQPRKASEVNYIVELRHDDPRVMASAQNMTFVHQLRNYDSLRPFPRWPQSKADPWAVYTDEFPDDWPKVQPAQGYFLAATLQRPKWKNNLGDGYDYIATVTSDKFEIRAGSQVMYPTDYIPDFRSDYYSGRRGYIDSAQGYKGTKASGGVVRAIVPYGLAGLLPAAVVFGGL